MHMHSTESSKRPHRTYWPAVCMALMITVTIAGVAFAQGTIGGYGGSGTSPSGVQPYDPYRVPGSGMATLPDNAPLTTPGTPNYATPYTTPGYTSPNTPATPGSIAPRYPNLDTFGSPSSPSSASSLNSGTSTPGGLGSSRTISPFSTPGNLSSNYPSAGTSCVNPSVPGGSGSIGSQPFSSTNPWCPPGTSGTLSDPNARAFGTPGTTGSLFGNR